MSAKTTASTFRNRTMQVGKRLERSAEALAQPPTSKAAQAIVVGLDGGYVKARHQRPERNFEVVAGKVLDGEGNATRFAFVRNGGSEAVHAPSRAFRRCGVTEDTSVTVLTDGAACLRTIHQQVAPESEHVLDWFHVATRPSYSDYNPRGLIRSPKRAFRFGQPIAYGETP